MPDQKLEFNKEFNLQSKIEAILFFKGEPISLKRLSEILKIPKEEVIEGISSLRKELENRGIVIQENNEEYTLGTSPVFSDIINDLQKEEISKELSKASLETLSIILYKNGAGRAEIDYIRGVNSSFTIRALSIRGLVEKVTDKDDSRRYVYKPSFELLSYMGVTRVEELPDYPELHATIDSHRERQTE